MEACAFSFYFEQYVVRIRQTWKRVKKRVHLALMVTGS